MTADSIAAEIVFRSSDAVIVVRMVVWCMKSPRDGKNSSNVSHNGKHDEIGNNDGHRCWWPLV